MSVSIKDKNEKMDSLEKKKRVNLPLASKAFHKSSINLRSTINLTKSDVVGETGSASRPEPLLQDKFLISRLKENAQKTRDLLKKKHDSIIVPPEKRRSSMSFSSEDYSNGDDDQPIEVGYSEVLENGNVEQMKARNVLMTLKKRLEMEKQKAQTGKTTTIQFSTGKAGNENQNTMMNMNLDKPEGNGLEKGIKTRHDINTYISKQNSESISDNQNFQISNYINTLRQNSNLSADTSIKQVSLGPDNKVIHIKTPDYFTFMRLEHEINEVIRKQNEFHELKKNYFEKKLKQKELILDDEINKGYDQERIKKTKDYQKGLNIADKYIHRTKKRKEVNAIDIAGQFINEGKKKNIFRRPGLVNNQNI